MTQIRKDRRDKEITQIELGRLTGIHPSKISLLERGLVEVRPDEEARLLAALKLCETRRQRVFAGQTNESHRNQND